MSTHTYRDFYPLCGQKVADEPIATEGETPTCIRCANYDLVAAQFEEYINLPVNFGDVDERATLLEKDAFFAGAFAMLETKIPF